MTMELPNTAGRPRVTVQAIFGLMVIAVGVLFTLDNLDILDARDFLQYLSLIHISEPTRPY